MKVETTPLPEVKVFKPRAVTVTVETKEELAALKSAYRYIGWSHLTAAPQMSRPQAEIIVELMEKIYAEAFNSLSDRL